MITPLCELALKWGTDKAGSHEYTPVYYELFKDRILNVRKVLEIGIGRPEVMWKEYKTGASLYMWQEFFPHAEIIAFDIVRSILFQKDRIRSVYCDQGDRKSLEQALAQVGDEFDLIIDDGSHIPHHQILSAQVLSPALRNDGVYVIEDVIDIDPEMIVAQIPSIFKCQIVECPSRRGAHEKLVLIKYA